MAIKKKKKSSENFTKALFWEKKNAKVIIS
jgi:hypothetical protein